MSDDSKDKCAEPRRFREVAIPGPDALLAKREQEIASLRAEIAAKDREIERLKRGLGAILSCAVSENGQYIPRPGEIMQTIARGVLDSVNNAGNKRGVPSSSLEVQPALEAEIKRLRKERDFAEGKLNLLNSFYACNADEEENVKLSLATKRMVEAEARCRALSEGLGNLVAKLKAREKPIHECIVTWEIMHRRPCPAPNWNNEIVEAETLLADLSHYQGRLRRVH